MCAGEAYSASRLGDEDEAQSITQKSLTDLYHSLIKGSNVVITYCGASEPGRVEDALREALLALPERRHSALPETEVIPHPSGTAPRKVTESLDVTQGKLVAGFRLGKAMASAPDYPALAVFNAVYGSGATSKLFLNVRERLALCYYASSILDKYKGVMLVSSGIEIANYSIALDEIIAQLNYIKDGDIEDWELQSAKSSVVTSVKSSMDSPGGLIDLYFDSAVAPVRYDPEELCDKIESVTLDDVVKTASEIALDTVYFLTGKEDGHDD